MEALKNRWLLLILGLLVGAYIGGELALRYSSARKLEYDRALEEHYIESRIWTVLTSTSTLAKVESEKLEAIRSDNQATLRGAFLTLVELHKSGRYERKDEDIRKYLKRAKDFMAERPDQFLDQEFIAASSIIDRINSSGVKVDAESTKVTSHAREQLQGAFDYVDGLAPLPNEDGSRQ